MRWLAVAALVLPLLVFTAGAHLAFRTTVSTAKADLLSDVAVAKEQVTRVLDTHRLIAGEVNGLVGRLDGDAIIRQEASLRAQIVAIVAPFPQVSGVVVIGADGRPLVTTLAYPVDRALRFDDRDYFQALRDNTAHLAIGEIVLGRLSHRRNFSIAVRRGFDPDRFDGLILVTVPPEYFEQFDAALFDKNPDYNAGVFRDDGANLARYPALDAAAPPAHFSDPLLRAIRDNPAAGMVRGASNPDDTERLIAYRKLDEYPVYVTVGRTWESIVGEWRGLMATHLIFGIPATLALFCLSLLAMRHERRQTDTVAALRAEADRRALAEEALRQSQKMEAIGRLTGGIAHDFNNNLTVISSSVELLKRRLPPGTEALHKLTDAAMQGVGRAATLTQRLLAFARQQPLEPAPLDAGRLVADMSDLLHRSLGESIALETVLAGGLWLTRADANQLENAVLNLVVNARDAMPDGGKLTIETANTHLDEAYAAAHAEVQPGQYVMLAITDTGTGMPPDVMAKAFEPFFTTKPVGQGTGLGLSMVYGFVRQSGGHVKIYSEPRQGTAIKIYLPRFVKDEARPPAAMPGAGGLLARGAGETILVVEDDEAVRRSSVEALRDMGYRVLEAADAMEGFRLVADRSDIDLLFTDIGLPGGVNGRVLADAACAVRPGLRVLFTTGYTRNAIIHNGMLDSGVFLLPKPFTLTALATKVREAIDAPASGLPGGVPGGLPDGVPAGLGAASAPGESAEASAPALGVSADAGRGHGQ